MSVEYVAKAITELPGMSTVFGDRIAYFQHPQSTDLTQKCLVYTTPSDRPEGNVAGRGLSEARVRFTVSANTIDEVVAGQDAVRAAADYVRGRVLAGHHVVLLRKVLQSVIERDDALGVWVRHDDYRLAYYD